MAPRPADAQTGAAEPISVYNQNPLIFVYGLPAARGAGVLAEGKQALSFDLDFSSHFVERRATGERLILDGETTRLAMTYRRGFAHGLEASIAVPFVDHSGGFADSAIDEFHDITGFSDGGRSDGPRERQLYRYRRNGQTLLEVDGSPSGLGDIRLGLTKALPASGATQASVSAQLELPTGDADELTGSESLDLALWGTASRADVLFKNFSVTGALGGLFTGEGEVIEQRREQAAGFGWLTLAYAWTPSFVTKAQVYVNSPLYEQSGIDAVDGVGVLGSAGFAWRFTSDTRLEWSISEDLNQDASPDVSFNLGLHHGF